MLKRMNLTTALGESAIFGYQVGGGFSTLLNSLATPNDRSVDALLNLKPIGPSLVGLQLIGPHLIGLCRSHE
jgi:hypothetical protein